MLEWIHKILDPEFYQQLISVMGPFGFVAGIALAMIESFIPPLPLAAFVTVNVITFGFLFGYLWSYIGTTIGAFSVFLLIRRYGEKYIHNYVQKHHKAESLLHWIHDKGVFPLFILLTFPFTPSIVVSGLAAFSEIDEKKYLMALIPGKFIMVLSLSFIGVNVGSFLKQPLRSALFIGMTLSFSFIIKFVLNRYEKRVLRRKAEGRTIHLRRHNRRRKES